MSGKKHIVLTVIMTVSLIVFASSVYPGGKKTYTEEDIGIRKETLYDEIKEVPVHGEPIKEEPGKSKKIERAFENSPPLIPHDITGMLPISRKDNMCIGCHMPDEASATGATPIPRSHFTDLDTGKDLGNTLDGKRYNCMQCHVIQTTLKPPIENRFKGTFRDKDGKKRSHLLDTINEGVKAE